MTLSLTSEHLNIASGLDTETMFFIKSWSNQNYFKIILFPITQPLNLSKFGNISRDVKISKDVNFSIESFETV